ncbi:MAG: helicase-related protein, partial [Trebonia sp.]
DDLSDGDLGDLETELVDEASAARTVAELEREIAALTDLERLAAQLRSDGEDRKWEELSALLTGTPEMYDASGGRRKLIIFSEHRDTLNYLAGKLRALLGRQEAVVTIHGGMHRDERRKAQEAFTQDPHVLVLVATDAAGEGINLQRAHLMVNYDLPWNPNRIEQRFGRIHRIGQTEVCHLWNLVAEDTREGQVFQRLFDKLDEQRRALGGQVFDVLGQAFADTPLRDLLIEAVRYGDRPDVRDRLNQVLDETVGDALREVVHQRALVSDLMTAEDVEHIREQVERAKARRLQPYFVQSFFIEAFALLGGEVREREPDRFEITKVPAEFRQRDRLIGTGATVPRRYERITFDRGLVIVDGRPRTQYVAPGHPLLDVTVDLIIDRFSGLMQQGAVLVDDRDQGEVPRTLIYLQHSVTDGQVSQDGDRRTVSKRFEFVEVTPDGQTQSAGWGPYLDLRPASPEELRAAATVIDAGWVRGNLEEAAVSHGITLARAHLDEVRRRTLGRVDRVAEAVSARLLPEIRAWDHRASELRQLELAGRLPASGMNSANARQRADDLKARLRNRLAELDAQRELSSSPPVVAGGALVVPVGLLARLRGHGGQGTTSHHAAIATVLRTEARLGRTPRPVTAEEQGYDVESRTTDGSPLFIMVRHRLVNADTFLITRSELGVARNTGGRHVLALVDGDQVRYVREALAGVPNPAFGISAVPLSWRTYVERGQVPQ